MAHASKKKMGAGSQGKGDGSGAMTVLAEGILAENAVLSNRDKAMHSAERGLDSRQLQTEQFHDHVGARRAFGAEDDLRDSSAGLDGSDNGNFDEAARVRVRAYEIWEQEGRPERRDELHWLQAERELKK
jgi:Protein of unknown function (DUF2934)